MLLNYDWHICLWQVDLNYAGQRLVIALKDYEPLGDDDLPLQKDQEYILIKSSHPEWWTVQDDQGWDKSNFRSYFH